VLRELPYLRKTRRVGAPDTSRGRAQSRDSGAGRLSPRKATQPLTFAQVVKRARTLPGIEASTSYGTPAIKVKGKFLGRLREDGETMVIKTPFVVRDHLMHAQPNVFFITDHYREYPSVLIRLAAADADQVHELVESAWRDLAPRRLVAEYDEARPRSKTR
jgi:hypothetical protein